MTRPHNCCTPSAQSGWTCKAKMCMLSDRPHNVGLHIPAMDGPTQVRNEYVGLTIVGPQIPTIGGHPGRMYM